MQFAVRLIMGTLAVVYFAVLPDPPPQHTPLAPLVPFTYAPGLGGAYILAHVLLFWWSRRRGLSSWMVQAGNWLDILAGHLGWVGDPYASGPLVLMVLIGAIGNGMQHGLRHFRLVCFGTALLAPPVALWRMSWNGFEPTSLFTFVVLGVLLAYTYLLVQRIELLKRTSEDQLEQLRQAQKLEAIGVLAGGVAHDMNNMLASIVGLSTLVHQQLEPDSPLREDVDGILETCKRGRDLTDNLLGFARKGKFRKQAVDLNEQVGDTRKLLERAIARRIEVVTQLCPDLPPVEGDPGQLRQVLMNLSINAVQAMDGRGSLTIRTSCDDEQVRLEVQDTGEGMSPEVLNRALEPFFTTKPQGQGTGLGLSMVYGTIQSHGGRLDIVSQPGLGTTVKIALPRLQVVTEAHRSLPTGGVELSMAPNAAPSRGSGTVLLVDDEPLLLSSARRLLTGLGYEVLVAENGHEALELFQAHKERVSAVILDLIMPVLDGPETLQRLKELDPRVKVLISSGYTEAEGMANRLLQGGAMGYLHKPYTLSELSVELARVIASD